MFVKPKGWQINSLLDQTFVRPKVEQTKSLLDQKAGRPKVCQPKRPGQKAGSLVDQKFVRLKGWQTKSLLDQKAGRPKVCQTKRLVDQTFVRLKGLQTKSVLDQKAAGQTNSQTKLLVDIIVRPKGQSGRPKVCQTEMGLDQMQLDELDIRPNGFIDQMAMYHQSYHPLLHTPIHHINAFEHPVFFFFNSWDSALTLAGSRGFSSNSPWLTVCRKQNTVAW